MSIFLCSCRWAPKTLKVDHDMSLHPIPATWTTYLLMARASELHRKRERAAQCHATKNCHSVRTPGEMFGEVLLEHLERNSQLGVLSIMNF